MYVLQSPGRETWMPQEPGPPDCPETAQSARPVDRVHREKVWPALLAALVGLLVDLVVAEPARVMIAQAPRLSCRILPQDTSPRSGQDPTQPKAYSSSLPYTSGLS